MEQIFCLSWDALRKLRHHEQDEDTPRLHDRLRLNINALLLVYLLYFGQELLPERAGRSLAIVVLF